MKYNNTFDVYYILVHKGTYSKEFDKSKVSNILCSLAIFYASIKQEQYIVHWSLASAIRNI